MHSSKFSFPIHLFYSIIVLLLDNFPFHFERGCEFPSWNAEVILNDFPLSYLLSSRYHLLIGLFNAFVDVIYEVFVLF